VAPITFHPPTEATVAVGLAQALTGSMGAQYKILEDKISQWKLALACGKLPRGLSWRGFRSMIWPSLRYPMAAMTFSPSQGDTLTRQFTTGLLPFLGCVRNFPMALRHSPPAYFGLNLPHVYWEQGTTAISTFLSTFPTTTLTGSLLLACLEQAQLEVGLGTPFLELDFEQFSLLLTPCWLRSVWEFLSYAGISLRSSERTPSLQLQWVGDQYLMDIAFSDPHWSRSDLLTINRCCLALHCITLADVATGDGCYLRSFSFPPSALPSSYIWPKESPSWADWHLWEKFLSQSVCSSHHLLRTPLGPWLRLPHLSTSWGYLNLSSSDIFLPISDGSFSVFHQRPLVPASHSTTPYDFLEVAPILPASARFIAIVAPTPNGLTSSGYALGPTPMGGSSAWPAILRHLGENAWPLPLSTPPKWLLASLQSGSVLAVCDGSHHHGSAPPQRWPCG